MSLPSYSLTRDNYCSNFVPAIDLFSLYKISYICNHTVCILWAKASFMQHVFKNCFSFRSSILEFRAGRVLPHSVQYLTKLKKSYSTMLPVFLSYWYSKKIPQTWWFIILQLVLQVRSLKTGFTGLRTYFSRGSRIHSLTFPTSRGCLHPLVCGTFPSMHPSLCCP